MAQDIRELMKGHRPEGSGLSEGHELRFEARLKEAFPPEKKKTNGFFYLKIAASVVVFLGLAYFAFMGDDAQTVGPQIVDNTKVTDAETPGITLGDLSPDLKKVEDFYTNGISVQLASLDVNDDNRELINSYLNRLAELDTEYNRLNNELNEVGPSEATISALIDNLQLRLELLFKLKNKLNELNDLKNEQFENMEA